MRRLAFAVVCCASAVLGVLVPVGAEVPGQPFTRTACPGDSDSVARLYTAGLGRPPEVGGFEFWMEEYTSGRWSFPRMAQFFVSSDEFVASYGSLTQDAFIRQLYRNVLGREGEAGGIDFWNGQMSAGMDRATVLMRFAESPENIASSGTTEPTLGPFNEGRTSTGFVCGPDLSAANLDVTDLLGAGWVEETDSRVLGADERTDECADIFVIPARSTLRVYRHPADTSSFVGSFAYPYATPLGANRYMESAGRALTDCASFDAGIVHLEATPLSVGELGDDVVAVRYTSSYFGNTNGFFLTELVVVRVGNVVFGVQQNGDTVRTDLTMQYIETVAARLQALL